MPECRDVALIVAGQRASSRDRPPSYYLELARELGVAERVRIDEGFIPDKETRHYFDACDVILLSYASGFVSQSGVLLVAANWGKPVLASSGPGPLSTVVRRFGLGVAVEPDSVDWVVSNCVINLSPDKPKVFAEIARVLKPGGRMLVSDIVIENLPDRLRRDERLYCSCIAGAISEAAYIDGLDQAGLTDVEVRERLVYDLDQLTDFIQSELPDSAEAGAGCGQATSDPDGARQVAKVLVGQVWSAKFFARKPIV